MGPVIEKGFDASWGWPDLQAAWNAGYRFICGYYSRDASKNWTPQRIAQARAIGFDCLSNFEDRIDNFRGGFPQGVADAKSANDQMDAHGWPANTWPYYSVDTAATVDEVRPYFQGIVSVGRRLDGGYGGTEIDQLLHEGIVKGWWEANAGSWSGHASSSFLTDLDAAVRQIVGRTLPSPGGSIDEDWLYSTAGLWLAANHPAAPPAIRHQGDTSMLFRHSSGAMILANPELVGLTQTQAAAIDAAYKAAAASGGPPVVNDDSLFAAVGTSKLGQAAAAIEAMIKAAPAGTPGSAASTSPLTDADKLAIEDGVISRLAAHLQAPA